MILTGERLERMYKFRGATSVDGNGFDSLLDTITDLESRLKAATDERLALIEHFEKRIESEVSERAEQARRLQAATEQLNHEVEQRGMNFEAYKCAEITILNLHEKIKQATEKSECGHPKIFWVETDQYFEKDKPATHLAFCEICAEVQAAYDRGLRDAYDYLRDYVNYEIQKAILVLKDRGAK